MINRLALSSYYQICIQKTGRGAQSSYFIVKAEEDESFEFLVITQSVARNQKCVVRISDVCASN